MNFRDKIIDLTLVEQLSQNSDVLIVAFFYVIIDAIIILKNEFLHLL